MKSSGFVKTGLPCPCGMSSDAFAINSLGHGHCFRGDCNKHFTKLDGEFSESISNQSKYVEKELDDKDYIIDYFPTRGLLPATLEFYKVRTKFLDEIPIETGFPYAEKSFKIRKHNVPKSEAFRVVGQIRKAGLFGKTVFDPGSRESITITEGEYDAMSIYQVTNGKTAAVSVQSSTLGLVDCKIDFEYINSFSKIIFALDGDSSGEKLLKEIVPLFDFKKVFIVKFKRYKDANEYLQNDEGSDLYKAWNGARRYTPDNIISSFRDIANALKTSSEAQLGTYPLEELQTRLYGLHEGEVIVFKGDEGIGKTEIFRMMEYHLLRTTKTPLGILHLEEDNGTTIKAIATYHAKEPIIMPDSNYDQETILEVYKDAVDNTEDRVFLHSSFDVEDETNFLNGIRFLVSGCGCRFIFLDHISWLATGQDNEDERKKLDRISQSLKLLAKELRFTLIMIAHVNDEGKTRGSRNITKVANTVIHMSRDKINSDPDERSKTYFTIEKARLGGRTGPAGFAFFDTGSYTLLPHKPGISKPELGE